MEVEPSALDGSCVALAEDVVFGERAEGAGLGLCGLYGEAGEVIEIGAIWAFEVFLFLADVFAEAEAVQELEVDDVGLLWHCLCFVRLRWLYLVDRLLVVFLLLYLVVGDLLFNH